MRSWRWRSGESIIVSTLNCGYLPMVAFCSVQVQNRIPCSLFHIIQGLSCKRETKKQFFYKNSYFTDLYKFKVLKIKNLSKSTAQGPVLYSRRANAIFMDRRVSRTLPTKLPLKVRVDSPNWYSCSSATPSYSLLCNYHSDLAPPSLFSDLCQSRHRFY